MSNPTDKDGEFKDTDYSGSQQRPPRPPGWDRHPVDGAGPDDDEDIEAEFYGHAEAFGIDHPDKGKEQEQE